MKSNFPQNGSMDTKKDFLTSPPKSSWRTVDYFLVKFQKVIEQRLFRRKVFRQNFCRGTYNLVLTTLPEVCLLQNWKSFNQCPKTMKTNEFFQKKS